MQPRVLAQTAVIERHVIRSELPGVVIDVVEPVTAAPTRVATVPRSTGTSEAGERWRAFMASFTAGLHFDDPGQPPPRHGGIGWMKVPLPHDLYANVYRSSGTGTIGVQVRFAGANACAAFDSLLAERDTIDAEFTDQGLPAPEWQSGDVPQIFLNTASPAPWNEQAEAAQRRWMARAANQFVNSLRPRLHSMTRELAA